MKQSALDTSDSYMYYWDLAACHRSIHGPAPVRTYNNPLKNTGTKKYSCRLASLKCWTQPTLVMRLGHHLTARLLPSPLLPLDLCCFLSLRSILLRLHQTRAPCKEVVLFANPMRPNVACKLKMPSHPNHSLNPEHSEIGMLGPAHLHALKARRGRAWLQVSVACRRTSLRPPVHVVLRWLCTLQSRG